MTPEQLRQRRRERKIIRPSPEINYDDYDHRWRHGNTLCKEMPRIDHTVPVSGEKHSMAAS